MREYCLVTKRGEVINMCMSYDPKGPVLNEYQRGMEYEWVPVNKVPREALYKYRYWNERP